MQIVDVGGSMGDVKAVFTRDQAIAVDGGAIICRMGPVGVERGYGRRGEESYITQVIAGLGMPILRTIHGTGLVEGGSLTDTRLIRVPLTGHALHIDGAIVMVDHDKALINMARLPYWFLDELKQLGIQTIHVWPSEGHAVNCLAVRPGRVLISEGCPRTRERLQAAGVESIEIDYSEIRKNGGGIHCSTLPLVRER